MSQYKYLETEEAKKKFNEIKAFVDYSANTMLDRRNKWEEVWQIWTQSKSDGLPAFQANARLPIARTAVNTFAAFLSAKEPTFNVYPVGTEDWMKAQFSRELLQFQAKKPDILDLRRKAKIMIKSACLFDVGIVKATWQTITIGTGKEKRVLKDQPTLENVHTLDFYPDPYIGRMADQTMVVERMVVSIDKLKNNPMYSVPADMKSSYSDSKTNVNDSSRLDNIDLTTGQDAGKSNGKVEVWECWTPSMVYTIADPCGTPVFIRQEKNPYSCIPYVKLDFEVEPVPNRFYGYGMITPNIDINKAINAVLNNIRDNVNILVNPMYKTRNGANVDPRQLISRPGGSIGVDSMSDIEQLQVQDTTRSGFNMLNTLQGLYQQGTRISSVRAGIEGGDTTATEAEIQQQNADVITNAVKDNFEQALSEIGTMVLKMNVDNMQGSTSIRIFNPELIKHLNERYLTDRLSKPQIDEALQTGQLGGYQLDQKMLEEIRLYGKISPEPLSLDDENRIKSYGKLIAFSKRFIDVDSDVIVEADSTIKKDSAVLRKQVNDVVGMISRIPGGVNMVDWQLYVNTMADLTGIPAIKKFIKVESQAPQMPQMPQEMQGEQMPGAPQAPMPPQQGAQLSNQAILQSVRSPQSQV